MGFFIGMETHAVSLPDIFSDHMVIQSQSQVTIWGWGRPHEDIKIFTTWSEDTVKVNTDRFARWSAILSTPEAGGPHQIRVKGFNELLIDDVMIGEVWLCSGQSNMEWTFRDGVDNAASEIQNANFQDIRHFNVDIRTAEGPQLDVSGKWVVCTPETVMDFTAIGYIFGKEIHQNMKTPVGLINSTWGGTPAEAWTPREALELNAELMNAANALPKVSWATTEPGRIYNAMIHPITNFKIKGVIWYQGESNVHPNQRYSTLFSLMIATWREKWKTDFPFYFVQIAPFPYNEMTNGGAIIRDQQRRSLTTPGTAMVVTSDLADTTDIHPRQKIPVGERLARIALSETYGQDLGEVRSPVYASHDAEGRNMVIEFKFAKELKTTSGKLGFFEIAGIDGVFYPASAKIKGATVILHSKVVATPVHARFAWGNNVMPNLSNEVGLPASTFTTISQENF